MAAKKLALTTTRFVPRPATGAGGPRKLTIDEPLVDAISRFHSTMVA
jgi:hypothetical protein